MTSLYMAELLDALADNKFVNDARPWGIMRSIGCPEHDITIKHITVDRGERTSLQYHERKDELIVILEDYGMGYVTLGEETMHHLLNGSQFVRIKPGVLHRVTGPLEYLEISTFDDDRDTIRVTDDYGRMT